MNENSILKVSDHVTWAGVHDKDIVTFDIVMETEFGTTYNSYCIDAEKKTLIDTVKESFWDEYREKLEALTDLSEIEYVICTHTEPDHSGSLKYILEKAPNATVVGSGQAINYLSEMMEKPFKSQKVKDGDTIDLGNMTLRIIGAPNLHWPDSIYAYLEEDKLLFTCDSFGAHFSDERMFDNLVADYEDSFIYYFDVILKPYSKFMLKAIDKIKDLPLDAVCPGHGPILRTTWRTRVEQSRKMAEEYLEQTRQKNRILVAYISAYGYTKTMAEQIAEGIRENKNLEVELADIENMLLGDMEQKLVGADAVIIGSPTINQNTLLPIYKLFSVMNPIRDKNKPAAVFGSYGWSGEAVKLIENHLSNLKFDIRNSIAAKFFPTSEKEADFRAFGKHFGETLTT